MILGVSSQAIALAGIIGAVVGLVGTLGVIFNTWIARRYEREARVWDAKSEANVRLLWYANRTMLDAERTYLLREPTWGEPLGLLPDPEYLEITAVAAFGTRRVLDALERFNAQARDFFARADELKEIEEKGGGKVNRPELEGLRQEARKLLEGLTDLVQTELQHRRARA